MVTRCALVLPMLVAMAGSARAEEPPPFEETLHETSEPLLSAGGGVGTYSDVSTTLPTIDVRAGVWLTSRLTLDLVGTLYPVLVPTLGPTYHHRVSGGELESHDLLFGVSAGAFA